jgi:hypothetical protein
MAMAKKLQSPERSIYRGGDQRRACRSRILPLAVNYTLDVASEASQKTAPQVENQSRMLERPHCLRAHIISSPGQIEYFLARRYSVRIYLQSIVNGHV